MKTCLVEKVKILALTLLSSFGATFASELPITLATSTGTIQGTLVLPRQGTKSPVVLIVAGSGPTDRDGNTALVQGKNNSLQLLAIALKERGIASVRYDKRGVAASIAAARSEADLRIENYVRDAQLWIEKLSNDSRFSSVTMLGHSEGSLIALLALQRYPTLPFISIAGPAEKPGFILRRQLQGLLPPELAASNEAILTSLEAGQLVGEIPEPLLSLYRPNVQPYLVSWFKYSPKAEIAKLRAPCLLVQGTTDIQVAIEEVEKLYAANTTCLAKRIKGMNHIMKLVPADRVAQNASYGDPSLPLAPELTNALTQFVYAITP